jgi:hypothetical protein
MPKRSSLGAADVLRAVSEAARRWRDADFPPRADAQRRIAARTGYTPPVVAYALDRLFESLDAPTLERAIVQELGSLEVLDDFVGGVRAYPVGTVVVVSSRTTIGVALVPAVYALCAKCRVVVKDREDSLIASYFGTLAQELPLLASLAEARAWTGGDPQADRELRLADAVVAFGGDDALGAIRASVRPGTRFVGYGARTSLGYVSRGALRDEAQARDVARGAARDLVLYDGEGCMSLHALFVERGGGVGPADFTRLLLEAVQAACVDFPAGRIDARVAAYCTGAVFREAQGRGSVFRTPAVDATLVLDPPLHEPPPLLPRILPVYSVERADECEEYVRSHALPLETFAIAAPDRVLVELGARLGAVRIALLGGMQAPGAGLHHGGRSRIADFIRWVDVDPGARP